MGMSYLKWAGGKTVVSEILLSLFTKTGRLNYDYWSLSNNETYHEWFAGSFSMFFNLRESNFITSETASVNTVLIIT